MTCSTPSLRGQANPGAHTVPRLKRLSGAISLPMAFLVFLTTSTPAGVVPSNFPFPLSMIAGFEQQVCNTGGILRRSPRIAQRIVLQVIGHFGRSQVLGNIGVTTKFVLTVLIVPIQQAERFFRRIIVFRTGQTEPRFGYQVGGEFRAVVIEKPEVFSASPAGSPLPEPPHLFSVPSVLSLWLL